LEEEKEVKEVKKTKKTVERKVPVMYMGPSVGNMLSQYSVFSNEVPKDVEVFMEECPDAKKMLIPVSEINEHQEAMKVDGSFQNVTYQKVVQYISLRDNETKMI